MSLLHTVDSALRHAGIGRMMIGLLPMAVQVGMRKKAWFERARRGEKLVDAHEISPYFAEALQTLSAGGKPIGDYLEFGVFNGTSLIAMHEALKEAGMVGDMRLIGFDSFQGLPPEAATAENMGWRPGTFASEMDTTRARLDRAGIDRDRAILVKGWLKDTLTPETAKRLNLKQASIITIDVDIYTASKEALDFCAPLIADEAFIILDDWHFSDADKNEGQKKAFDQFLAEHPEFHAEPRGNYSLGGKLTGEVFRIIRNA